MKSSPSPAPVRLRIGVLALQGDFAAHLRALDAVGAVASEIRTPRELEGLRGLVIPGGESTTLLRLMRPEGLDQALLDFHAQGGFLFGTCAGLILLARTVTDPLQESLGLCDLTVRRNGFGRQIDSFVGAGRLALPGQAERSAEMVFIRAPRITRVGPGVETLGWWGEEPVLVAQGRILAATYHPEMSSDPAVHAHFLAMAAEVEERAGPEGRAWDRMPPGRSRGRAAGAAAIRGGPSS